MAHQDAYAILNDEQKDKLANIQGDILKNYRVGSLAYKLKKKRYSGDIKAGSVTFARFTTAKVQEYGTARTAGKGEKLNNKGKVIVLLDKYKEIVEEVNEMDLEDCGYDGILEGRKNEHTEAIISQMDNEFFEVAEEAASEVVTTGLDKLKDKIDAVITSLQTTKNEFVDGIPLELISITLNLSTYKTLRSEIDTLPNANVGSDEGYIELFHGVRVYPNMRQTARVLAMVTDESIAQPGKFSKYNPDRIAGSQDYLLTTFAKYGTKAIAPDLIKKITK